MPPWPMLRFSQSQLPKRHCVVIGEGVPLTPNSREKTMFESMKSPRFKVQSPFLQQLRGRIGRIGFWLVLVLVPLFFLRACVFTYVPPGQIGVRQVSYGFSKGLQKE